MATSQKILDAEAWSALLRALLTPLSWLTEFQERLVAWLVNGSSPWSVATKMVLLVLPSLVLIGALWCTIVSGYTLAVRSERRRFVAALLVAWWELVGSLWLFWGGLLRVALALPGLMLAIGHLALKLVAEVVHRTGLLLTTANRLAQRRYFQGGVPWVALLLLLIWCAVEAGTIMLVMFPAVSRLLVEVVGVEPPVIVGPALHLVLFLVAAASFACVQLFLDALELGSGRRIAGRFAAVLAVLAFEVVVLFRTLIDAVAPWIATRTGLDIGFLSGIGLACALWIVVRVPSWFLFGRFGVPAMNAIIARKPVARSEPEGSAYSPPESSLRVPPLRLRYEIDSLQHRADALIDGLTLALMQMPAALLNIAAITVTSNPVFALPLRSSKELSTARKNLYRLGNAVEAERP